MRMLSTGRALLVLCAACCAITAPVAAQDKYPSRPIRMLVGWAPGGAGDLPARYLADAASKILGQSIVVVNKEGGASALALAELRNARPDGYVIGQLVIAGVLIAHLEKVAFHPVDDFDPIVTYLRNPMGLVASADAPFKTLRELVAYTKANPDKVNYSSAGIGSPGHIAMLQLGEAENLKWTHIPYGGGNPALTALLGGHVTFNVGTTVFKPHVEKGRLRLLASLEESRLDGFPDAPTLIDQGYKISVPIGFQAIIGPKGMPKEVVATLHDAFRKAIEAPGFRKVVDTLLGQYDYRNPADTKKMIESIYASTGKVLAGVKK